MWLDKINGSLLAMQGLDFYQDNFIEHIDFDYLDFQVIEEDY